MNKETILYPSCSEYIAKLGIKKEELPYIEKRVKELFTDKKDRKYLLEEFTNMINMPDVGSDFINTENVEPYNKIKDELLAKRDKDICPFCKEKQDDIKSHIKEFHSEEIKKVLRHINKKEYSKIRKELILDSL